MIVLLQIAAVAAVALMLIVLAEVAGDEMRWGRR